MIYLCNSLVGLVGESWVIRIKLASDSRFDLSRKERYIDISFVSSIQNEDTIISTASDGVSKRFSFGAKLYCSGILSLKVEYLWVFYFQINRKDCSFAKDKPTSYLRAVGKEAREMYRFLVFRVKGWKRSLAVNGVNGWPARANSSVRVSLFLRVIVGIHPLKNNERITVFVYHFAIAEPHLKDIGFYKVSRGGFFSRRFL